MENLLSGKRFSFTEKNLHEIEIRPATDIAFISLRDYYKDLKGIVRYQKSAYDLYHVRLGLSIGGFIIKENPRHNRLPGFYLNPQYLFIANEPKYWKRLGLSNSKGCDIKNHIPKLREAWWDCLINHFAENQYQGQTVNGLLSYIMFGITVDPYIQLPMFQRLGFQPNIVSRNSQFSARLEEYIGTLSVVYSFANDIILRISWDDVINAVKSSEPDQKNTYRLLINLYKKWQYDDRISNPGGSMSRKVPEKDVLLKVRDLLKQEQPLSIPEIMAETKTSRLVVTRYAKFLGVTPPRKYRTLEDIFAELN